MLKIVSFNLDGQMEFTIPDETAGIAFHAQGGNVEIRSHNAGDPWTILAGQKESLDARTLAGQRLYLSGTSGTVLEIRILQGLLS